MTPFGPKAFQRTTGHPDVFHETFAATAGTGRLEVFNGGRSGDEVTSARVVLNGTQVIGPDDFRKGLPFLEVPVALEPENALRITLAGRPGTNVVVRVTQALPFEEDDSGVIKADLAVTDLALSPGRCAPQTPVRVQATVTNWGRRVSGPATLVFTADGSEIGQVAVDPLRAGASASFSITWTVSEPGRHQVWARVQPEAGMIDRHPANDARLATLRVSGESSPVAELEFGPPQFSPGPPAMISMQVHNPSFADLTDIPLWLNVAGPSQGPDLVPDLMGVSAFDDEMCEVCRQPDFVIAVLAAGDSIEVQFAWPHPTVGQYIVQVAAGNLPETFYADRTASWNLILPTIVADWQTTQPLWSSLGPYLIIGQLGQGPPNTGRISALAVHPYDPNIIYAGGASLGLQISGTGLWKTADGGQSWKPLGDKFPQMNIMAIALDPINADIVYAAAGVWRFDPPTPVAPGLPNQITGHIFKSVDGGQHWAPFAHPADGYSRLVVRRHGPSVVIYAASNRGVLRYVGNDPGALSSQPSEWTLILDGKIADVVVDPGNPDVVFAVRHTSVGPFSTQLDGLYRTKTGLTATGKSDWSLRPGFTVPNPDRQMFVDLFKGNPKKIRLLTWDAEGGFELRTSADQGDGFSPVYSFSTKCGAVTFVRIHPTMENLLYAGCDQPPGPNLLRIQSSNGTWYNTQIPGLHADQHAMEFFFDPTSVSGWGYVVGNDGGVYRGRYVTPFGSFGVMLDTVTPVNLGLISAEFYDTGFDVSLTSPDVMIGGTQDNGVVLAQPFGMWKNVVGGDGTAAVIAPGDSKTMYAKSTSGLHSGILRSKDGGVSWPGTKHVGVVDGGGPIFTDPGQADVIYVGGAQVQQSIDGGDHWGQIGPADPRKKGQIVQVLAPGILDLYAGTDQHAQIWFRTVGLLGPYWTLIDEHPDPNAYVVAMALAPSNPDILFVVYGNCTEDKRLRRFQLTEGAGWSAEWMTGNLPEIHATTNTRVELNTIAAHPADENVVFVGTDKGVYQGVAFGNSWFWLPFNNGLPLVRVSKLISVPPGEIRAATTGRGAWKVKLPAS